MVLNFHGQNHEFHLALQQHLRMLRLTRLHLHLLELSVRLLHITESQPPFLHCLFILSSFLLILCFEFLPLLFPLVLILLPFVHHPFFMLKLCTLHVFLHIPKASYQAWCSRFSFFCSPLLLVSFLLHLYGFFSVLFQCPGHRCLLDLPYLPGFCLVSIIRRGCQASFFHPAAVLNPEHFHFQASWAHCHCPSQLEQVVLYVLALQKKKDCPIYCTEDFCA